MKRFCIFISRVLSIALIFLGLSCSYDPVSFVFIKNDMVKFIIGIETFLFSGLLFRFVSIFLFNGVAEKEKTKCINAHTWGTLVIISLFFLYSLFFLFTNNGSRFFYAAIICAFIEILFALVNIRGQQFGKLLNNNVVGLISLILTFVFSLLVPVYGLLNNYSYSLETSRPVGVCALLIILFLTFAHSSNKVFLIASISLFLAGGVILFVISRQDYGIPLIFNAFVCLTLLFKNVLNIKKS